MKPATGIASSSISSSAKVCVSAGALVMVMGKLRTGSPSSMSAAGANLPYLSGNKPDCVMGTEICMVNTSTTIVPHNINGRRLFIFCARFLLQLSCSDASEALTFTPPLLTSRIMVNANYRFLK